MNNVLYSKYPKSMNNDTLLPINTLVASSTNSNYDVKIHNRLNAAWALVVGPALVNHTRLLQVHNSAILIGCWNPDIIISLRLSIENIWPNLKLRLEQMWQLKVTRVEVIPCDPLESSLTVQTRKTLDPFKAVLEHLRRQNAM